MLLAKSNQYPGFLSWGYDPERRKWFIFDLRKPLRIQEVGAALIRYREGQPFLIRALTVEDYRQHDATELIMAVV